MSRTIKRGAPPRKPVRKKVQRKQPLIDRLLARLPVSQEVLAKVATWSIMGAVGAGVLAAASYAGVPGMIGGAVAEQAGHAGLKVGRIEITGLKRMDRMSVYAVALEQESRAMPLVDLAAVREKLLRYGWIADAQVSRRLPDTLLVHIVEREPAAVWQDNGQLTLIDAEGVLLEPVDPANRPDLPLRIGPGADRQERGYQALLAAAPSLKGKVHAATWVGDRRWDLTFKSGEVLALPEEGADKAIVKFAGLDARDRLLGRGFKRFDMRDPARMVVRKPAASERAIVEPTGNGADMGARPMMVAAQTTGGEG
ncbi:cell division protein FtsQ/DivIB [Sphingomonas lenta]|uniref:Cell division protein FtsQ n=1 Tax=Sphingomonas lenta TaxID=1141887 RepID=A0A2A2SHG3_9SPHN|nr:cell division protein FtsQ/DivIB [Sphingomonas lenta]PAX08707.1 cell division protein FtsQ [Sphingomonas lenta]